MIFLYHRIFFLHCSNLEEKLQDEALNIPGPMEQLLSDYGKRFNEIKTPRKLLWKKNLRTVKVSLTYFNSVNSIKHKFLPTISFLDCFKRNRDSLLHP